MRGQIIAAAILLLGIPAVFVASVFLEYNVGGDCPGLHGPELAQCAHQQASWLLGPLAVGFSGIAFGLGRVAIGRKWVGRFRLGLLALFVVVGAPLVPAYWLY